MRNVRMMHISGKTIDVGVLPFNLHLRDHKDRMILYGKKGITITRKMKDMLIRENRDFYISHEDLDDYLDYTINNLENIVHSKRIPEKKKAEQLRSTGRQIMTSLRSKIVSKTIVKNTKKYTQAIVDLIVSNTEFYHHLLNAPTGDSYFSDHALNSCAFCVLVGLEVLGREDETDLFLLGLGGLLHDIGMAHIDPSIVNKKDDLTPAEKEVIKMHVQLGYNQLVGNRLPEEVLHMTLHHHERADGSGYPDQLKGKEIGLPTMIVSVCDVYDALTSRRSFRSEQRHIKAIDTILQEKHLYFDEALVGLAKVVLRDDILVENALRKHNVF